MMKTQISMTGVTDPQGPPDSAKIGCLSQVTLALASHDKEVQKKVVI